MVCCHRSVRFRAFDAKTCWKACVRCHHATVRILPFHTCTPAHVYRKHQLAEAGLEMCS